MSRQIKKKYRDPLDIVWLHAANECGIRVERDKEVFASWDGQGLLRIGSAETLDADDCLAQMILHELCHALVAGPDLFSQMDWGLDYDDETHRVYEHATLRLQAALADEVQMRHFFASTTDFRDFFDRLPIDPLQGSLDDRSIELTQAAFQRLNESPWAIPIRNALSQTRAIADIVRDLSNDESPDESLQSIWID